MENLIFLLATSFVFRISSPRRFKNYFIGDTGCSALLFTGNDFQQTRTITGDQLYFNECSEKDVDFGIICIRLQEEYTLDEASSMLKNYMDKLKDPFFVLHETGVQADTDWNSIYTRTLVDYWQDTENKDWKVKGYTNGHFLAVLYVKNISQVEVRKQDLFLDSFHFRSL